MKAPATGPGMSGAEHPFGLIRHQWMRARGPHLPSPATVPLRAPHIDAIDLFDENDHLAIDNCRSLRRGPLQARTGRSGGPQAARCFQPAYAARSKAS